MRKNWKRQSVPNFTCEMDEGVEILVNYCISEEGRIRKSVKKKCCAAARSGERMRPGGSKVRIKIAGEDFKRCNTTTHWERLRTENQREEGDERNSLGSHPVKKSCVIGTHVKGLILLTLMDKRPNSSLHLVKEKKTEDTENLTYNEN